MIKTIQRRLDAILHWNISFVGGFLGGYAILSHAGVFGSAQTGNLMEMASNVRFMEWEELGLRLLAMVIFACGVIASYMLTNYTNLHMRKLAIWVDAAGLDLRPCCRIGSRRLRVFTRSFFAQHSSGVYIPAQMVSTARRSSSQTTSNNPSSAGRSMR